MSQMSIHAYPCMFSSSILDMKANSGNTGSGNRSQASGPHVGTETQVPQKQAWKLVGFHSGKLLFCCHMRLRGLTVTTTATGRCARLGFLGRLPSLTRQRCLHACMNMTMMSVSAGRSAVLLCVSTQSSVEFCTAVQVVMGTVLNYIPLFGFISL